MHTDAHIDRRHHLKSCFVLGKFFWFILRYSRRATHNDLASLLVLPLDACRQMNGEGHGRVENVVPDRTPTQGDADLDQSFASLSLSSTLNNLHRDIPCLTISDDDDDDMPLTISPWSDLIQKSQEYCTRVLNHASGCDLVSTSSGIHETAFKFLFLTSIMHCDVADDIVIHNEFTLTSALDAGKCTRVERLDLLLTCKSQPQRVCILEMKYIRTGFIQNILADESSTGFSHKSKGKQNKGKTKPPRLPPKWWLMADELERAASQVNQIPAESFLRHVRYQSPGGDGNIVVNLQSCMNDEWRPQIARYRQSLQLLLGADAEIDAFIILGVSKRVQVFHVT
jgi:hypothetical protein